MSVRAVLRSRFLIANCALGFADFGILFRGDRMSTRSRAVELVPDIVLGQVLLAEEDSVGPGENQDGAPDVGNHLS